MRGKCVFGVYLLVTPAGLTCIQHMVSHILFKGFVSELNATMGKIENLLCADVRRVNLYLT